MSGFFVRNLLSLSLLPVGVLTISSASSRLTDPSESAGERARQRDILRNVEYNILTASLLTHLVILFRDMM